ncbi:MAG: hypothetical protein CMP23_02530 [Rickettsiales bacterium]|mgnify:CR=1 FL=1|nr:hypothetical protein [Rickettsiales bacterium]
MKRAFTLILSLGLGLLMAAPVAIAQSDEPDVRYRKRTEIDFEDVSIDGELKKPHGAYLLDKRQSSFNPLIRLKENFNQEMIDSVNQVR